jgi:hypothetical protein
MLRDMETNKTPLESAFDLARSGKCLNIGDVQRHLKGEGYSSEQLEGRSIRRQLLELIKKASLLR